MSCYVCGTPVVDATSRCDACGVVVVDVAELAMPGVARLVGTAVGARLLTGPIDTILANPPIDVVPKVLDLTDAASVDEENVPSEAAAAAEPDVTFDAHSLFAGPDGHVDESPTDGAADLPSAGPGAVDDLFGSPAPAFLTLDDPVQKAAFGLDETEVRRSHRSRGRRGFGARTKVEFDAKTFRPILLTGLLVVVTAWVGLQTLTESQSSTTTTTIALGSGPDVTHDADALLALAGDHAVAVAASGCGASTNSAGFLLDDTSVVTTRSAVAGDASPDISVGGEVRTASVLAWSWSPDLAIVRLDEPVTAAVASLPPTDGLAASRFSELFGVAYDGARSRAVTLTVEGPVGGWAGTHHALDVTASDPVAEGTLVMTGQGQVAGIVGTGPEGDLVVVTLDAIAQPLDDLARATEPTPLDCSAADSATVARWTGTRLPIDALVPGADPVLDDLYDGCAAETWTDCDDLRYLTDPSSAYFAFGATCGSRLAVDPTTCSLRIDVVAGAGLGSFLVGDCVVLSRVDVGTSRPVTCDRAHEAQIVHLIEVDGLTRDLNDQIVLSPEIEQQVAAACEAGSADWIAVTYWDRPLETGMIRPVDVDDPFACFVYQPGVLLTEPLV